MGYDQSSEDKAYLLHRGLGEQSVEYSENVSDMFLGKQALQEE